MKKIVLMLLSLFSVFLIHTSVQASEQKDTQVFYNGKVYTADFNNKEVTAFVVKDGKFVYVGNDEEALKYGKGRNLRGKRVIPGLVESHAHPIALSSIYAFKNIYMLKNIKDPQKAMLELKEANQKGKFKDTEKIFVFGAAPNQFFNLNAKDIDEAISDKPVCIYAADGHTLWMNTAFMKDMDINKNTKDFIPGASYFRRDKDGNPTGFLAEPHALLSKVSDSYKIDKDRIYKSLKQLNSTYNSLGYTSIVDAGFILISNEDGLKILKKMEDNNELTMHYYPTYYWIGPSFEPISETEKNMIRLNKNYSSDLIKPDTLKMFADGVIETKTALLRENYPGTDKKGSIMNSEEAILIGAKMAKKNDFNIHVHAIGDGAVENALNAFKKVGTMNGTKTTAHSQIVPPDLLKKYLEQKDVIYQTTLVWTGGVDDCLQETLGMKLYSEQIPVGRVMNNGNIATFGSDSIGGPTLWNVFLNIYLGIKRADNNPKLTFPGNNDGITAAQGIDGYTINGAKQQRAENNIGSITIGKSADFVIINRDILNIPAEKILPTKILETWFRGKNVYKNKSIF